MSLLLDPEPGPATVAQRHVSGYSALSRMIKEAGLLDRRYAWYAGRCLLLGLGLVTGFVLLFTLGGSPAQLLVAAGFGVLFTQVAFLAHDAAHRQIFVSGRRNEWSSLIIGNLIVGPSHGWWMRKHSRHHGNPNKIGADDDIAPGALVFTAEDARQRTGVAGWFARRQGWLFPALLLLAGLDLHRAAVGTVLGPGPVKHRPAELILIAIRLLGFPILVLAALGPGLGLAFLAVQVAVFGVCMGGAFAPNHKGMPIVPKDAKLDFLSRQVLMSRNISGGRMIDWLMGGLNYQIEHHLFPSMPSVNLRLARPLIRAYCAEHDLPYTETSLLESHKIVIRYLNQVGLGESDPFSCPLTAQLRSR
ncbi:fatty acid desaturase family protein [Microlunatus speluncae]|uniref:fatty acid desaturase family protein n=1 Tax=Microlunatus speluncae TaxID=2594267 RepID=UPI001266115C|nr:acyl-CoA desaturase [Microlunatus speluncae]